MNKQDCVGINSWQEVERRLQGTIGEIDNWKNEIRTNNEGLMKVNNSLNSFLDALVLNLKDLLENQSEISLWFFDIDMPTKTTKPYIDWNVPSDHEGDFLYSRTKGVVYQFLNNEWIKNNDDVLLRAMALTNTELVPGDNERKVFTQTPSPPYESGDWWIKNDGVLYICQTGKNQGQLEEYDFIISSQYANGVSVTVKDIADSKRKVFTEEPKPPYEKGDLWIRDNQIYICEVSKNKEQTYSESDFNNYLDYTDDSFAEAIVKELGGETTTILSGTVIEKTARWVTFTDLATGGKTEIAGDNIKSGTILSNNYKKNQLGMAINLNEGTIDTKNFKVDKLGNISLSNGAQIISEKGMMTNLQFAGNLVKTDISSGGGLFGCYCNLEDDSFYSDVMLIYAQIPTNFTITSANIEIVEHPIYWSNFNTYGYIKEIAVCKIDSNAKLTSEYASEDNLMQKIITPINNVFGTNKSTWTPTTPNNSNYKEQKITTIDLTSHLNSKSCIFAIKSNHNETFTMENSYQKKAQNTCLLHATLNVLGYMNF